MVCYIPYVKESFNERKFDSSLVTAEKNQEFKIFLTNFITKVFFKQRTSLKLMFICGLNETFIFPFSFLFRKMHLNHIEVI